MGVLRLLGLALVVSACAPPSDDPAPSAGSFVPTPAVAESFALPDGDGARAWGDGPYGVVLIGGAWDDVAQDLARHGMRAVVPNAHDAGALRSAIVALRGEGIERVAVLAVGGGVSAAFEVGTDEPDLVDQLITVSAVGDVTRLGPFPKFFVASEGEPAGAAAPRMAADARGAWNLELLVPGDASGLAILDGPGADELLDGILRRLEERR